MSNSSRWSPEVFDAKLKEFGAQEILKRSRTLSLDDRILFARAALTLQHKPSMRRAVQLLVESDDHLAVGITAVICAQAHQPATVLSLETPAYSSDRRDLDGLSWFHFARAIVLVEQGCTVDAHMELAHGIAAAAEAGLPERVQLLRQHVQWAQGTNGRSDLHAIHGQLNDDMAPIRRNWFTGVGMAGMLERGQYQAAAEFATPSTAFQAAALSLIGKAGEVTPNLHGTELAARCWQLAWDGERVPRVTGVRSPMLNGYARLALGADCSRTVAGARLVDRVIGAQAPALADQAVLWSAVGLSALGRGGLLTDPLDLAATFTPALRLLDHTDDVLKLIARVLPEALIAASFAPGAHDELVLMAYGVLQRAGWPSLDQVTRGLAGEDVPTAPGRFPNLGVVVRIMDRLIETAAEQGRTHLERHWQTAQTQLLFDHGARSGLSGLLTSHCMGRGVRATVKA